MIPEAVAMLAESEAAETEATEASEAAAWLAFTSEAAAATEATLAREAAPTEELGVVGLICVSLAARNLREERQAQDLRGSQSVLSRRGDSGDLRSGSGRALAVLVVAAGLVSEQVDGGAQVLLVLARLEESALEVTALEDVETSDVGSVQSLSDRRSVSGSDVADKCLISEEG